MSDTISATLTETARSVGLVRDEMVLTGFVGDPDLVRLYNLCELFVLPSVHEGFGLPALEAMACGAAVIGSAATSIPEVIQWRDALFDPLDEVGIAGKITKALTDEAFRLELVRRGLDRAKAFSWDLTGKSAIAALEKTYATTRPGEGPATTSESVELGALVDQVVAASSAPASDQDLISTSRAIARNHPAAGARQILVDVSELIRTDPRTGIQRVVKNLLTSMGNQVPPGYRIEPVYATSGLNGYRYATALAPDGSRSNGGPTEVSHRDTFLGLDLRPELAMAQTEFYSEIRRLGGRVYFVVYDLLPVLMPDRFVAGTREWYERWLATVVAQDGALCISRSVAAELATWMQANGPLRQRPYRLGWFHLGYDHHPSTHGLRPSQALSGWRPRIGAATTFVMVGTIEPRKGHKQALAAFERLWARGLDVNLVLAGKRGWMMDDFIARVAQHPEYGHRLLWMPDLGDDELEDVYVAASCVLIASEGEGFGLPLIEAARHGTPILSRDLPVFREVAGDNAIYFTGLEPADLAAAVDHWLGLLHRDAVPPSSEIHPQTWDESARQVLSMVVQDAFQTQLPPTPELAGW
jgi:glycosyltransferase involved in cell wall biosynthesis